EVRYSPDGAAICNVSIATTSVWKDRTSGERREETEWPRVAFSNRLPEIAGEKLKNGRPASAEGPPKARKRPDKAAGADRYSTESVADQMQMLGGREGGGADSGYGDPGGARQQRPARAPAAPAAASSSPGNFADMDDDIPF